MNFGPFYFDSKEIFLILAALLVGAAMFFGWPIYWFDKQALLTIIIIILVSKGLLPSIHNEAFFILSMATILLTIYISLFQAMIFYFVAFLLLRLLKVI